MSSIGGPIRNYYVIDEMDLKENGGRYSIRGGYAIRVSGFDREIPTGGRVVMAGPKQPVYIISKGQLRENGGRYVLKGGPETSAIPASALIRPLSKTKGGPAIPVYVQEGLLGDPRPDELESLVLWYDAQSIDTLYKNSSFTNSVASDGDPVGGWQDKSGSNFHATQMSGGRKPTYKIVDGLPYVSFDNVNDYMKLSPSSDYSDWTVFFVLRAKSITSTAEYIMNLGDVGSGDRWIFGRHIDKLAYYDSNPGWQDSITDLVENLVRIYSFRLSEPASGEIFSNDFQIGDSLSFTQRKFVPGAIGTNNNGQPTTKLEMDLGEVMFFNEALSDGDYGDVIDYLKNRWFISPITPPEIDGLVWWLDADDISTLYQDDLFTLPVASDGDPVGGWQDKSGKGNDVNQSTLSKRPTYRNSSGEARVDFDSADDYLRNVGVIDFVGTNEYTMFFTIHPTNVGSSTTEYLFDGRGGGSNRLSYSSTGKSVNGIEDGLVSYFDNAAGGWKVATEIFSNRKQIVTFSLDSPSSGQIFKETKNIGDNLLYHTRFISALTIHSEFGGGATSARLYGKTFEILVYNRVLTDLEREGIIQYLSFKWSI